MHRIQMHYTLQNMPRSVEVDYSASRNYGDALGASERLAIARHWQAITAKDTRLTDNDLGTLVSTEAGRLVYDRTSYSTYRGIVDLQLHTAPHSAASRLRVSSVGVAVRTSDKKIVVQQRPEGLTAGGKYDSSAAGFCIVKDGVLDFDSAAYEKLERELGIDKRTALLRTIGVHTAEDFCSGMVSYYASIPLSFAALQEKANPAFVSGLEGVPVQDLASFVIETYCADQLIGDGCATFLAALQALSPEYVSPNAFYDTVTAIRKRRRGIEFGAVREGVFSLV